MLADTALMGGVLIGVRFYLGRLIGKNLFGESQVEVEELLVKYISQRTSAAGGELVRGLSGWSIAQDILRYEFEKQSGKSAYRARKLIPKAMLAVELFLKNPSISMAQLAKEVGTTEKQLARNSLLNRVLWVKARREQARV